MPGKDKIIDLIDITRVEGQFQTVDELLISLKKKIDGFDAKIDLAKNMNYKEAAGAQAEYNKAEKESIKIKSDLLKVQILENKERIANANALKAEAQLRAVNEKAAKAEAVAIEKRNAAAAKYQSDLSNKLEAARAGVTPDVPFTVNKGGETFNENAVNQPTEEQVQDLKDQQDATEAYAKAQRDLNDAKEEGAKIGKDATEEYVLELTPLEEAVTARNKLIETNKSLRAGQIEDKKLLKAGSIDRVEYNKRIVESNAAIEVNKTKIQTLNREVKAQAVMQNSAAGSLEHLRAKLVVTTIAYDRLTEAQKKGAAGAKIQAEAKALATAIDTEQSKIGNYTKNVGNYFSKAYSGLRVLANILPGVGIAGIIGAIGTALLFVIEKLEIFESSAHRTIRQINELTGISQGAKDALKGMGESADEIAGKALEELSKDAESANKQLGNLPSTIEKAKASIDLLTKDLPEKMSGWRGFWNALLQGGGVGGTIAANTKVINEYGKEIVKLTDGIDKLAYAEEALQFVEQDNAIFQRDQQKIKDQQAQNDRLAAQARAQYSDKNSALNENFKLENELIQNQYDKSYKDAKGNFAKEFEAQTKFNSDSLNAKRKHKEDQQKLDDEYAERYRKATLQEQLIITNDIIKTNEKVSSDSNNIFEVRIDALKRYGVASSKLLDEQQKDELAKLGLTPKEIEAIYAKYNDSRVKLAKELEEKLFQIQVKALQDELDRPQKVLNDVERFNKERIDALQETVYIQERILDQQYDHEVAALELSEKEKFDIALKYQEKRIALAQQQNKKIFEIIGLNAGLKKADENLKSLAFTGDKTAKMLSSVFKFTGSTQADIDNYVEAITKMSASFKQLGKEVTGGIFDILVNSVEREKNAVQDLIDKIDVQKEAQIALVNRTITDTAVKADKIAIIEADAAAKHEALDRRQRQLDQKKAAYEKQRQIAEIIGNTAAAVTSALGAKPWSAANIALAAVIGAIGAVQVARIIATPIPRYREGTGKGTHPGGPAIVGDGGRAEGLLFPDGTVMKTASSETMMDLPEGTQVFSDWNKMFKGLPNGTEKKGHDPTKAIEKIGRNIVAAIKLQPKLTIVGESRYKVLTQTGSSFMQNLNL